MSFPLAHSPPGILPQQLFIIF
jgi:hypothetical protein